jgi:hypothetical protein
MLLSLWLPVGGVADDKHPLDPLDLSSPRATLNSFLTTGDAFFSLLHDEYWHTPSRAAAAHLSDSIAPLERTLDLSEIPPAARFELGRDVDSLTRDVAVGGESDCALFQADFDAGDFVKMVCQLLALCFDGVFLRRGRSRSKGGTPIAATPFEKNNTGAFVAESGQIDPGGRGR